MFHPLWRGGQPSLEQAGMQALNGMGRADECREMQMSEPRIRKEVKDRICTLTLNEPEKLNAMSEEMAEEFREAIKELRTDPEPRVLILTGAGRAFSAGGNLKRMLERAQSRVTDVRKFVLEFYKSFLTITDLEIPTIAAVNGHAIGAGGCLALACDMRIAARDSKIGFTFAKIGLHPGMGAEYFLSRTVGRAATFELLMTGDLLSAEEAHRIGLVNSVVPTDELMGRTRTLAEKIASMPVLPIRMLKESIDSAMRSSLMDTIQKENDYQAITYMSEDIKEGILAVMERRKPRFTDSY
jgi:enoyl-CoA hydratase